VHDARPIARCQQREAPIPLIAQREPTSDKRCCRFTGNLIGDNGVARPASREVAPCEFLRECLGEFDDGFRWAQRLGRRECSR